MANRLNMTLGLQAGKNCKNFLVHLKMTQLPGVAFGHYRDIRGPAEQLIVLSEQLSKPAFQSVAAHRVADLAADGDAEARDIPSRINNDNKVGGMKTLSLAPDSLVFAGAA